MTNPLRKTMVYLGLADEEVEYDAPAEQRSQHAPSVAAVPAPGPQRAPVTPLRRLQGLTVGTDDEIVNDADDAGWPRWMHLVLHFEDDTRVSLPMQSEGVPSTRRELAQFLPVLVAHTRGA